MKISYSLSVITFLLSSISTTHGFTLNTNSLQSRHKVYATESDNALSMEDTVTSQLPNKSLSAMSTALPFLARPAALDGTLAGDVGFDPFGFAKSREELMSYREAEIKHARLAMLAAAGWPISELFDKQIAIAFGLQPALDSADRVPALLNGGLDKISPLYWGLVLGAAAAIDMYGFSKARNGGEGYIPGDLGFDPLGVYPKDKEGQNRMQLAEIKNGRLAMIAIFAFAVQEFVTKMGVVDQTPIFFKPIGGVLKDYANSGYIHG